MDDGAAAKAAVAVAAAVAIAAAARAASQRFAPLSNSAVHAAAPGALCTIISAANGAIKMPVKRLSVSSSRLTRREAAAVGEAV